MPPNERVLAEQRECLASLPAATDRGPLDGLNDWFTEEMLILADELEREE